MRDIAYLSDFYANHDEEGRLEAQHGQVEFLTTMHYIDRYLMAGMRVLEIGAGAGRYSHHLARRGYVVDAVELVQSNVDAFCQGTLPGEQVTIRQGDALNLDGYADASYDVVLLLGPMYHLFAVSEQKRALCEALRVTKPGGLLYTAYCMEDGTILDYGFMRGNALDLVAKGLLDAQSFCTKSTPAEVFQLYCMADIDGLMVGLPAQRLHYVATDLLSNYSHMRDAVDGMDAQTFALYMQYHLMICERQDVVGLTNHSLDVVRKC